MSTLPFAPDEFNKLELLGLCYRRRGASVPARVLLILLGVGLLGLVIGTEYALFLQIFENIKGPDLPGEAASWSTSLLALTGMLMMLGFHIYAEKAPRSRAVRFIDDCAGILLPLYAVGAGLAVASVVYFDGADMLVAVAAESSRALFSAPEQSPGTPGLDRLIGLFPVVFSIGCGGLALVNLFVSHHLASMIAGASRRTARDWRAASEARAAIAAIRATTRRHEELTRERDALLAVRQADWEIAAAHEVMTVIGAALNPHETWLADQSLRGNGPDERFAVPQSGIDPKALSKKVAALRAITLKSVIAAMRGAKE